MMGGSGDASLPDFAAQGEMIAMPIELEVNGKRYPVHYDPDTPLLYVLRDELGLAGTKYGCGEGRCGACTVVIAGAPRRSCQLPTGAATGELIIAINGIE